MTYANQGDSVEIINGEIPQYLFTELDRRTVYNAFNDNLSTEAEHELRERLAEIALYYFEREEDPHQALHFLDKFARERPGNTPLHDELVAASRALVKTNISLSSRFIIAAGLPTSE